MTLGSIRAAAPPMKWIIYVRHIEFAACVPLPIVRNAPKCVNHQCEVGRGAGLNVLPIKIRVETSARKCA